MRTATRKLDLPVGRLSRSLSPDFKLTPLALRPHYGSSECKAWDGDLEPFCADSSGNRLAHAPDWCEDQFCYVDPNNCDSIMSRSGMFPDAELFYSYATCGSKNRCDAVRSSYQYSLPSHPILNRKHLSTSQLRRLAR